MLELDVLSWNLNGLDSAQLDVRTEAAIQLALLGGSLEALLAGGAPRPLPHVLLFQEVVTRSLNAHLRPHLRAAGYRLFPDQAPDREYFELMAVRAPWDTVQYTTEPLWRTQYGRWQHRLDLAQSGHAVSVFTAHLDSGREAATERQAQLLDLARQLEPCSVFAGDANLRDAEWARHSANLGVRDVWEATGAAPATRWTWRGHKRSMRLDRAWIGAALEPRSFELVGGDPGQPDTPSDHAGIRIVLGVPATG